MPIGDLRLRESCYCRCLLTAPWILSSPGCDGMAFHFVAHGDCVFSGPQGDVPLSAGDLVVLPTGVPHRLGTVADPAAPCTLDLGTLGATLTTLEHGGGGEPAVVLCGGAQLDPPGAPRELLLSDVVVARSEAGSGTRLTLALMQSEAQLADDGTATAIARLCDVLVIQALRAHAGHAWAGASDDRVAAAVRLVHADPAASWTVARLAAAVHLSQAAFTRRFRRATGQTPAAWVTAYRMALATSLLRDQPLAPGEVATRTGYASVEAFSRAYKRATGRTPGTISRAAHRTSPPPP